MGAGGHALTMMKQILKLYMNRRDLSKTLNIINAMNDGGYFYLITMYLSSFFTSKTLKCNSLSEDFASRKLLCKTHSVPIRSRTLMCSSGISNTLRLTESKSMG